MSEAAPTLVIDCAGAMTEAEFWQRYADAVGPDAAAFGRNLDAFWDAVENGGPGSPGDRPLHFVNTEFLALFRGGYFLEGLREIAAEATATRITVD